MKKLGIVAILFLLISLTLLGCGKAEKDSDNNTEKATQEKVKQEDQIPEPYSKAISFINAGDFGMANTYLDLMLTDFPESEYIFPTYILKGSIEVSNYLVTIELLDIFYSVNDIGNPLHTEEDVASIKQHLDVIRSRLENYSEKSSKTFTYVKTEFKSNNTYNDYFKDIDIISNNSHSFDDLSFFKRVGTPVPSEFEINDYIENKFDIELRNTLDELSNKDNQENYNFLNLFLSAGITLKEDHPKLAEDMYSLVLELTADDPYNEFRIVSLDGLAQLKEAETQENNEPQVSSSTDSSDSSDKETSPPVETKPDTKNPITEAEPEAEPTEEVVTEVKPVEKDPIQNEAPAEPEIVEKPEAVEPPSAPVTNPYEWNQGIKKEFENSMIQNGYVEYVGDLIYKQQALDDNGDGYYGVYAYDENGEEQYIVTVNVKTGDYHG